MPRYNLIVYSGNYSKTSGSVWQYYRDEPPLTNAGAIANFHATDNSALFKFKQKTAGKTGDGGTKDIEIMVSLKYSSNFWRTLEMHLINYEINLILTWSDNVLSNDTKATSFAITNTKPYVPVVTLSTQYNAKLLEQLKSGFKRTINFLYIYGGFFYTINWNKHQPKVSVQAPNPYL